MSFTAYSMMIGSKMPNGEMVPLNIPVSDCYYTGTMMNGSGLVTLSQCNNDTVKYFSDSIDIEPMMLLTIASTCYNKSI